MKDSPTVFVIDDDLDMCASLKWLLESVQLSVETYHSGAAYLEVHDSNRHGCLLIDMRMADMSGLQLIEKLNEAQNAIPIIVISAHGDIPLAVRAMKSGAVDFVTKPFNEQLLLEQIQALIVQDKHRHSFIKETSHVAKRLASLTPREREIMDQIVLGKLNKQIAHMLGISMKTVEQHRARLMEKMQVNSLAELIRIYYFFEKKELICLNN